MSDQTPKYLTGDKASVQAFVDKYDTFLFDCDGVLWSGSHIFPGTVETLSLLRSKLQKRIIFVTNNSTKSRADYVEKLQAMGIPATEQEVFSSSYSAAVYISRILKLQETEKPKVFVLGESGIEKELKGAGVEVVCGTDTKFQRPIEAEEYKKIAEKDPEFIDPGVGAVLAGLDFHPSYLKTALAFHYIKYHGAKFLATNIDTTLPSAGMLFPGAGTTAAPLTAALKGQEPLAFGKPSQAMLDAIEGVVEGFERSKTCMVGDRVNTDIRFGVEGGLGGTLAVLTGVSGEKEVLEGEGESGKPKVRPAAYLAKLSDLLILDD